MKRVNAGESYTYVFVDKYNKEPYIEKYKFIHGYVVTPEEEQTMPRVAGFIRIRAVPPFRFPASKSFYSAEVEELIPATEVLM